METGRTSEATPGTKHSPGGGNTLCIWKPEYLELQALQRAQEHSPRFDLRDLASAAIRLALGLPNAIQAIRDQALKDALGRSMGGQPPVEGRHAEAAASPAPKARHPAPVTLEVRPGA
jgi:hypothetical protein